MRELQALLEHDPAARDAREQLVRLLQDARRWDDVETHCRAALPIHPAESFFAERLGVALWWKGLHDDALGAYRLAARIATPGSPPYRDARFLEASALLTLGRYEEGWAAYAFRASRFATRALHPEIIAEPRPLDGPGMRVRIHAEQGLGDELFFLRFAPALRAKGHRLSFVCEPKLARFLSDQPVLFDDINAAEPSAADVCIPSGDLPIASASHIVPSLIFQVDGHRSQEMRRKLESFGPPPYIGVTWRAGMLPGERSSPQARTWTKDIAPEALGDVLAGVDASIVIVQRKPDAAEVGRFRKALGRDAADLSTANDDLSDAVALLSVLDDYIGVSNTNMHLRAGLPGKRARVLVLTPPEWRWGSPVWFPAFFLYRQRVGRDWGEALAALRADLSEWRAALQQP
jgi:hypothetical protein